MSISNDVIGFFLIILLCLALLIMVFTLELIHEVCQLSERVEAYQTENNQRFADLNERVNALEEKIK